MKKTKQLSATVIALLLAMTTVFSTVLPVKAANGPSEDSASISISYMMENAGEYPQSQWKMIYSSSGQEISTVAGVSYDKKTNTLTLTNYNNPTHSLSFHGMGDDFKISLAGDSHIQNIVMETSDYGCSLELTGNGTLYVNENKTEYPAHHHGNAPILVRAYENNSGSIRVTGNAKLHAYAAKGNNPVYVPETTNKDCIIGKSTPAVQSENYSQTMFYWETTGFSSYTETYDVYRKQGDSNLYVVKEYNYNETKQIGVYVLLWDSTMTKRFMQDYEWFYGITAEEAGYVKTENTVDVCTIYGSQSSNRPAYSKDSETVMIKEYEAGQHEEEGVDGNSTVVADIKYKIVPVIVFANYKNSQGEEKRYCTLMESGDETPYDTYEAAEKALKDKGYTEVLDVFENLYNIYVTGEEWILEANHKYASTWSSDASNHWKACIDNDGAKDSVAAHTFKEIIDKAATTTAEGSKHEQCEVCGYKKTAVTIEKLKDTSSSQTTTPGQQTTPEAPKQESTGTELKDTTSNATVTVTNTGTTTDGKVTDAEVSYAKPTEAAAEVTIPDTVTVGGVEYAVTSIEKDAFKGDDTVTKVTVGENVKTIDSGAFSGCKNLKTVKIGSNVETIGSNAFAGNAKLTTVDMGKNVTTVGDKAFQKCTSLKKVTIPATVTKVGKDAFAGCTKMTSATIGKNVKDIGANAFSGNKKLKTVTIKTSKVPKIGKNAFKGLPKDATIKVPKKLYKDFKKKLTTKTGFKKTMRLKKV